MYTVAEIKVSFGDKLILPCSSSMTSGTYSWTKDNELITAQTRGIAFDTTHTGNLTIVSMIQQLVGIYQCFVNDQCGVAFDVKVVGRLFYILRIMFIFNLSCSI